MKQIETLLRKARIGMITNQSAFGPNGEYHFQTIRKRYDLKKIFLPEHGLFAELQDQVSGSGLRYDWEGVEFVNLYGDHESSLVPDAVSLEGLDLILVDIRDTGARYYTFLTTAYYFLEEIGKWNSSGKQEISVLVIDSSNPAGRKVEGTPLQKEFESFVGVRGVLHRHGLTPGELLSYYVEEFSINVNLKTIRKGWYRDENGEFSWIPPSPNIPFRSTCYVYSGQCLLEGTNLSEGRGTTRPFEIFGAPYVDERKEKFRKELERLQKDVFVLRPLKFVPTFHKHKDLVCGGYQILLRKPEKFHALYFTLKFIRMLREEYPNEFAYRDGAYEFRSDRPAIELLVGDRILLDYLNGEYSDSIVFEYLQEAEASWRKKSRRSIRKF
ncbi:DUF1343 domain-containing protein [Leptospira gomenensis]|uniref:DUF1343 domain-containing protein n=1 Tax=Leptospira gomenensis TaxID=2484974 RepID=A0A5F1Y9B1_9LEPT|nr:DUF1343 domain-containing protein [Leptospira gomenensis]TGK31069.1 DUF1343 domain-containing protein [Leptospira gomenensis]TGK43273.1 DUF1343 domain-containing protein [Leptospira gomenensis]TGK45212.1 DUF1343 domain-containing protein [Leptospira gomenensis]TGK66126.1 DUF1343 domain-containing protein [Leptospira gomenensis]